MNPMVRNLLSSMFLSLNFVITKKFMLVWFVNWKRSSEANMLFSLLRYVVIS